MVVSLNFYRLINTWWMILSVSYWMPSHSWTFSSTHFSLGSLGSQVNFRKSPEKVFEYQTRGPGFIVQLQNGMNCFYFQSTLSWYVFISRVHYPGVLSPDSAINSGKQLWSSEDYSSFNDEVGGGCWARVGFIISHRLTDMVI